MRALLLLPVLLLNGCLYGLGRCTYETRSLDLRGTLEGTINGQQDSGTVSLSLAETKGSLSYRSLDVSVQTFLAGAISTVELRDRDRPASPAIITITGYPGQPGSWSANIQLTSQTPSHLQLELLGKAARLEAVVRVGTGGSSGTMQSILEVTNNSEWTRPYCD